MPVTLRTLTIDTLDILGVALADAPVSIRLTTSDQNDDGSMLAATKTYETNASGHLTVDLVPNAIGTQGTQYLVKIEHPTSTELVVQELITMPDAAANFKDLVGSTPPTGSNALLRINNLSDVAVAATARENLGLEIGVDVSVKGYSSLWFHGIAVAVEVAEQKAFTKITSFVNVGREDATGNVIGDATTGNDITIGLDGDYSLQMQTSFKNDGGGSADFIIAPYVVLNTPKTIADATNTTPIVITSVGHGLKSGDGITQSGVGGNTAANGDFSITYLTDDTYSLQDLAHSDIAGNGAYTSGGTVDAIAPGEAAMQRVVSNTQLGRGACRGTLALVSGDVVEGTVVNKDGTDNLSVEQITMSVERIGD